MPRERDRPAKPRQRSRKVDNKTDHKADQRNQKVEAQLQARSDSASVGSPIAAPIDVAPVEAAPLEVGTLQAPPLEAVTAEAPALEAGPIEAEPAATMMESATETALSGEVLPPENGPQALQAAALQAITVANGDYTRKSLQASRLLIERLIAVRSFDEAVEIQGEFARQAYANFLSHSQKICVLYGEWAQQLLGPFENLAPGWTRAGR